MSMEKYTKVKKIGEGSFGKALLVRHKENGKQFVVKEINMSKMAKKERDEARKEVAVLAQLNHPNIVTYRESFEEIGNLYIVMDYCDAGDLYSRINTQKGLLFNEDQIIDWFVQTCLAIKHIHDRKILHRDIKSQNIFMTRHGIVKLGDFGIAKVLNSTVELSRTCIGTPYYLSPEMCENKPYNNKSDIWSLGCVLYELTTLKHAFEAGNMKNLVLKIIRGNFPPPPPRYSYDLRSLINQLFKRSPRDRPSINSLLKKPILQARIRKYLSESEVADEFSHTVMHGVKMKKALPLGGARPLPPKPQPAAAKRPPSAPTPRYNPASVYGVPVSRKSRDVAPVKKSSDGVRKSGGAKRPGSSGGGGAGAYNADLARRKQELVEKERKRREEARKKENAYAKQHQDLIEKQKNARMNKAREEGWKGLLDSLSSDDSNRRRVSHHGAKLQPPKNSRSPYLSPYAQRARKSGSTPRSNDVKKPAPSNKPSSPGPLKDRPNYDHYHDYLEKLERDRKAAMAPPKATPVSARDKPDPAPRGGFDPVYNAMRGQMAGAQGNAAAERARLVQEYQQRQAQAARYKARGQGDLYGGAKLAVNPPVRAPAPKPSVGAPKPSAAGQQRPHSARSSGSGGSGASGSKARPQSAKEKQEQEYLARLKQIRLQNFNDRRGSNDRGLNKADDRFKPPKTPDDADSRKKKIEALRAQADERARRLKEELERKRKAAYEQERRNLQNGPRAVAANKPVISAKPSPAVPITQVLNAIGAAPIGPTKSKEPSIGMTGALKAIGARDEENRASIQKTKEQILKRLNAKSIDPEPSKDEPTEDKHDRPKWGQPVKPAIQAERPKWGEEGRVEVLANMSLEQTASQMEATSARDVVFKNPGDQSSANVEDNNGAPSARKNWGAKPSSTVLNILKAAGLNETSASNASVASDSSGSGVTSPQPTVGGSTITISKPSDNKAPVIGSTITIAKEPNKGTIVIKKSEVPSVQSDSTDSASSLQQVEKKLSSLDKELLLEEKEQDETEDRKDKQTTQSDKSNLDVTVKTSPRPKLKSRSPSPKPSTPKSSPEKPKKIYQPEIQVEIKDLPDAKAPLFSKVDLDEDNKDSDDKEGLVLEDLDEESEQLQKDGQQDEDQLKAKSKSGLLMGLCTGNFDIGDIKLLRTCSEPNLGKLFQTDLVDNPFYTEEEVAHSIQLAAAVLEEHADDEEEDEGDDAELVRASLQKVMDAEEEEDEENDEGLEYSIKDIPTLLGDDVEDEEVEDDGQNEENQEEDEDEEDEEEDEEGSDECEDDEADMETLRKSMMDILDNEATLSEEESMSNTKKKGKKSSKMGKKARMKRRERLEAEAAAGAQGGGDKKSFYAKQWSASSVEDFKSMRETMKSLLQPDAGTKPKLTPVKEAGAAGDGSAVTTIVSLNPNTEAWQSDEDNDPDDDYWEEEDMFSRLEESRIKLEEELGCDTFMKAYKTVQAIHEDEDENMEEGLQLVTKILGETKAHLYPSILQLVMADGVWTEDND